MIDKILSATSFYLIIPYFARLFLIIFEIILYLWILWLFFVKIESLSYMSIE